MNKANAENRDNSNVLSINPDFQSFSFFMDWSNRLQFTEGFSDLYKIVLEAVQTKTSYNNAWIVVSDPENKEEAYVISIAGDKKDSILDNYPQFNLNSDPMLREIKHSHTPVVVDDAKTDPRTNKEIVEALGNQTIINIPIVLTGEFVGVLASGSFGDEGVLPPSDEDINFLTLISQYVGPVIVRILEQEKQIRYQNALKKAKLEAEHTSKLKSEFIENVTHELRTPLHAINGFVQLLELESENFSEDQVKYLADINKANTRLLSLIENVLDFESSASGNLEISVSDFDIVELVDKSVSEFKEAVGQKHITIIQSHTELENKNIRTDKKRLKQIIDNLLSNAIEHNRENGTININISTEAGEFIKVSLKDSGIGIPDDKKEHLFSPFARINTNSEKLGAGISLVISKQLADVLKGELNYESTQNEGSTFWIEIPVSI